VSQEESLPTAAKVTQKHPALSLRPVVSSHMEDRLKDGDKLVRRKDVENKLRTLKNDIQATQQKYFDEENYAVNPQAINELRNVESKVQKLLEEVQTEK